MGKYETSFKLKVVESFLAGDGGAKLLARQWSVPEEKIRTWVSHYRQHGIAALQPKRGAYTADFKLQVLRHQDRDQLSSRQVAAIYDVRNPNQVVVWRRVLDGGGVAALEGLDSNESGILQISPHPLLPAVPTQVAWQRLQHRHLSATKRLLDGMSGKEPVQPAGLGGLQTWNPATRAVGSCAQWKSSSR